MSTVSEMLAAQLRSPGFRSTEPGYEPDDVLGHLASVHELVVGLERRIDQVRAQARAAEAAAERAEAHATVPAPDDDELLTVVFEGQRRADDLLAAAEHQAVTLEREADARIAELRDDSEVRRLAAAVEATRGRLERTQEALRQADDDLRTVAEATRRCRETIGDRLAAALADLTAMELVTERA